MDARFLATAFATAFTIIDPIGMIPMTLTSTARVSPERRNQIVDQAVIVAAAVMLFMGVVGRAAARLSRHHAAGIHDRRWNSALLDCNRYALCAADAAQRARKPKKRKLQRLRIPQSFRLAVPMIAGPGTIATVLLLVNLSHGDRLDLAIVALAYGVALFVTWLCMRGSPSAASHRHDGYQCRESVAGNYPCGARGSVRAQWLARRRCYGADASCRCRPSGRRRPFRSAAVGRPPADCTRAMAAGTASDAAAA